MGFVLGWLFYFDYLHFSSARLIVESSIVFCFGRTTRQNCSAEKFVLGCFFGLAFGASAGCVWKSVGTCGGVKKSAGTCGKERSVLVAAK